MAKKRTTLDAVFPSRSIAPSIEPEESSLPPRKKDAVANHLGKRPHVKQQALYLKHPVHRQLRVLAFEEEKKMHELCMEALDLLFADRGLPSLAELEEHQ